MESFLFQFGEMDILLDKKLRNSFLYCFTQSAESSLAILLVQSHSDINSMIIASGIRTKSIILLCSIVFSFPFLQRSKWIGGKKEHACCMFCMFSKNTTHYTDTKKSLNAKTKEKEFWVIIINACCAFSRNFIQNSAVLILSNEVIK